VPYPHKNKYAGDALSVRDWRWCGWLGAGRRYGPPGPARRLAVRHPDDAVVPRRRRRGDAATVAKKRRSIDVDEDEVVIRAALTWSRQSVLGEI